jgi:hypothetical protein
VNSACINIEMSYLQASAVIRTQRIIVTSYRDNDLSQVLSISFDDIWLAYLN